MYAPVQVGFRLYYYSRLMKQYTIADIIKHPSHVVVRLQPTSAADVLAFFPGQYAAIGFSVGARKSPMRCFSITSSPHDTYLEFSMRLSGNFTRTIAKLQVGQSVDVQGPYGDFVLDPSDKAIVMLAAGIGITPYMSMLRHAADTQSTTPMTLLYACRSVEDIPFYDELRALQAKNPAIRIAIIVTNTNNDPANSIYAGRIDSELLRKATNGRLQPYTFFVCGPARFSKDMHNLLSQNGVRENAIVTEAFSQATGSGWSLRNLDIAPVTYALAGLALIVGVGAVMAVDLIRYVPKATANATPTTTSDDETEEIDDSSANTVAPASSTTTNSATSNAETAPSSSTTTTTPTTTTSTYTPPISRQS